MLNKIIEFLTSDDEEEEDSKLPVKKNNNPRDEIMNKARDKMDNLMNDLNEVRLGSGYLQEKYGDHLGPNFDFVVFPSRVCTMGMVSAISRVPDDIHECEQTTIISQACNSFESIAGNILNGMNSAIEQALHSFIYKHDGTITIDPSEIKVRSVNSWLLRLETYQEPDVENMYGCSRLTANTVETIAANMYIYIESNFMRQILNHIAPNSNDTSDMLMQDFYTNFGTHIRAFIYDTLIELFRVASLYLSALNKEGIEFDKFTTKQKYLPEY